MAKCEDLTFDVTANEDMPEAGWDSAELGTSTGHTLFEYDFPWNFNCTTGEVSECE